MNRFLAKSNPEEMINEHTDNLIKNYNLLKEIYPSLNINWDILYKSCLYHDLGKMNIKFQDKLERRKRHNNEIPHGILSLLFIDFEELEDNGYSEDDIRVLFHAIAYHHDRELNYTESQLEEEIELINKEFINFKYDKLDSKFINDYIEEDFFVKDERIYEKLNSELFFKYILVKGLLNRIDYAASGGIDVEKENNFLLQDLEENLLKKFKIKNPNAEWNELQKYMIENRDNNLIIVAQTGMGKTEAGLLWIGDNKGFFTLPLKTAINAMYKRITEKIVSDDYENKVGLLHSDIKREYLSKKEEIDFDEYYNKTKQLSLALTVCTMDQIFDFVYRYRGFESKLATLAYSKVVIDEVQMYSPDLLAYLVVGLSYIDKIGGKFAILTATLPQIFVELLEKEDVKFLKPEPFTNKRVRHSVKTKHEKINSEFVKEVYNDNKILVICNTVKEAQRIYGELSKDKEIVQNINLFHSRFIKKDRKRKEDEILEFGNKEKVCKGIWITTQVVEASLDIDFDILVTELSDLNGLFQRFGRCYRDRDWDKEGYNCYVFDGGDSKCSGVGNIIDEYIFKLSKEALDNVKGPITENEKINLIDSIYTMEKLKETEYHDKLIDAIKYLKLIDPYEMSKKEVMERFRNIESKAIIPKPIYEDNKVKIDGYIKILKQECYKYATLEERKRMREEKLEARISLDDFTLSIPLYRAEKHLLEKKDISKYEFIEIFECDYNDKVGIIYKSKDYIEKETRSCEDRIF
ncbi:CRISPR-associated helicase Cas3' [Tissierella sp.]|uniref:CRISPR-associated helicase Cas3' n=1 Tax=Tissierella sp. TaxID=41274 RepID=UPI0028B0D62F|nr:CRISPR-associated helicase Cas3' [Tissierella sp.]